MTMDHLYSKMENVFSKDEIQILKDMLEMIESYGYEIRIIEKPRSENLSGAV